MNLCDFGLFSTAAAVGTVQVESHLLYLYEYRTAQRKAPRCKTPFLNWLNVGAKLYHTWKGTVSTYSSCLIIEDYLSAVCGWHVHAP